MTSYKFADVVLVPFPFTDQTTSKKRPAVVVSSDAYNRQHSDIIIMAITSQIQVVLALGEVIINEWREAGLIKPSIIKPILATVEKRLVIRKLGELKEVDRQAVKNALLEIIGG
jgi:mRNA interferase MazF